MIHRAYPVVACRRNEPNGPVWILRVSTTNASRFASNSRQLSSKCVPASVKATPCGERFSSENPSLSSSSLICLLTTEGVVRRSRAAWVKLRRSATRTKVLSLFRSLRVGSAGIFYSRFPARLHGGQHTEHGQRAKQRSSLGRPITLSETPSFRNGGYREPMQRVTVSARRNVLIRNMEYGW